MQQIAIFLTLILWANPTFSNQNTVRVSFLIENPQDKQDYLSSMSHYYLGLLTLSLDQTLPTDGPYQIENLGRNMSQRRAFEEIRQNKVDVFWSMTSIHRESISQAIHIPLLKGMLGHRVFIIREDDQQRFDQVTDLQDLAFLIAGQGSDWPDYNILKNNGLKIVGSSTYQGLFSMLQRGRFDYFPRGINEPWTELRIHKDKNLAVEKNLLLRYAAPIYFFVNQKKPGLSNRVARGLRIAIKNGAFQTFMYNHRAIKNILDKIDIQKRRIFNLTSDLTPESAAILNDQQLWYQPGEEQQWLAD